jgi:hypothetical protein
MNIERKTTLIIPVVFQFGGIVVRWNIGCDQVCQSGGESVSVLLGKARVGAKEDA